jgi:hypothetical protein
MCAHIERVINVPTGSPTCVRRPQLAHTNSARHTNHSGSSCGVLHRETRYGVGAPSLGFIDGTTFWCQNGC